MNKKGFLRNFLGMNMQSPFILGSGPLSFNAEAMIAAHHNGAGAVVTKTIRDLPADNPLPHISLDIKNRSLINAELWSDLTGEQWVEREIPAARKAGVNVIASIGHTMDEVRHWVPLTDSAGAQAIELVSYDESTMLGMVQTAVSLTGKPILAKLSPNWENPLKLISKMTEAGVSGFTAMDSIGPVLRIDIETGKSMLGSGDGRGWLTGSSIKPVILHYVASLARITDKPIIGLGGVMCAEDAVEMSMAGASAIGLCTALMIRGIRYLKTLIDNTNKLLNHLGYNELEETRNKFNLSFNPEKKVNPEFSFIPEKCTDCGSCRTVCSYGAQKTEKQEFSVDYSLCRFCGLCVSVCPTKALTFK